MLNRSPPSRGCGSKLLGNGRRSNCRRSPPSRGCGSKHRTDRRIICRRVSPPSRGCGSKLVTTAVTSWALKSPPSRGCGSKQHHEPTGHLRDGHPLHGGVDRNIPLRWMFIERASHPLHGGVDRNTTALDDDKLTDRSPPSRGCGSKQYIIDKINA